MRAAQHPLRNTLFSSLKWIFILWLGFGGISCASVPKDFEDLPLFAPLNDWLYRGAQPTEKGLHELKEKGIRTVVNFRREKDWIEWERKEVESLGMKYVSLPWSIWKPAKPALLDATNRPLVVVAAFR